MKKSIRSACKFILLLVICVCLFIVDSTKPHRDSIVFPDYTLEFVPDIKVSHENLHMEPWQEEMADFGLLDKIPEDVWCLSQAIFHEARGEPDRGKVLVVQVILNRTGKKAFPDTPCEVVYQPSRDPKRPKACQFSFTCNEGGGKIEDNLSAWNEALELAFKFYYGLENSSWTKADHYHRCDISTYWSKLMRFLGRVGKHCFYVEEKK